MRPTAKFFLCQYRVNLNNYDKENGFAIVRELDSPYIPAELNSGYYFVLEAVRRFQIDAIITLRTTEEEI